MTTPEQSTTTQKPFSPEKFVVRLKFFGLVTCKPKEFVERLEKLCQEFVDSPTDYSFSWDSDFTAE